MKLIGFIREHNNVVEAQKYSSVIAGGSSNENAIQIIIDYLNSGILLLAWMGYFMDLEDNSPICPDSYYTDGVYVWPAYFPYYLKKHPNYLIDEDFLSHISKNYYLIDETKLKEGTKSKLEISLSEKLNESWSN
nr:hypothetical protein [uncultured Allomuricauda sp.]